jgi:membrane protein insertase Oxa1/YidC/SpoIIIJ
MFYLYWFIVTVFSVVITVIICRRLEKKIQPAEQKSSFTKDHHNNI